MDTMEMKVLLLLLISIVTSSYADGGSSLEELGNRDVLGLPCSWGIKKGSYGEGPTSRGFGVTLNHPTVNHATYNHATVKHSDISSRDS